MAKARVAIVISGRGSNMAALIYAAKAGDCPFEIVSVIGDAGSSGLTLAVAEGIKTVALPKPLPGNKAAFFEALGDALEMATPDCVALAGFMHILPLTLVDRWRERMINIHPSLLPKYKGLDTHTRAIAAGDAVAGCSVHLVTPELDAGAVLDQTEVAVLSNDTPETLAARVLIAEHQLYPRVLAAYVQRDRDPDWLLRKVRELAMAQPEADEITSHGMPCFGIIKGKKFAYFTHDHHGDGKTALLVKISGGEEQAMLIESDSDRYYRPAYFGDGWIGIRLDLGDTDWDHIGDWIAKSWRAVAPKKLAGLMGVADQF